MKSERWSDELDIKKVLQAVIPNSPSGLILYSKNGNYAYTGEGHSLILGVSGCGKSRRGTIPQIRSFIEGGESFICIDPKGEIFRQTACFAQNTHKIIVINFRNPLHSMKWNPLKYAHTLYHKGRKDKSQQMVKDIINTIVQNYQSSNDPFWRIQLENLLGALINILVEFGNEPQCNFLEASRILKEDSDTAKRDGTQMRGGLLSDICKLLPFNSPAKHLLEGYLAITAETTRTCVIAETQMMLNKFFTTEAIKKLLCNDEINIASMDADKPLAIYIIIPDENRVFGELAGILVSQLTNHFIMLADDKYDGKLPVRMNLVLEELGNIGGSIPNLPHLMSASRSRNMRLTLVLQSLSQLNDIYGRSAAETILSNADVWIAFRTSNWNTLQELSNKCGQCFIRVGSVSDTQPLITPNQLAAMDVGQALVIISGRTKFITKLPDYSVMFDCKNISEYKIETIPIKNTHPPFTKDQIKNRETAANRDKSAYLSMFDD